MTPQPFLPRTRDARRALVWETVVTVAVMLAFMVAHSAMAARDPVPYCDPAHGSCPAADD